MGYTARDIGQVVRVHDYPTQNVEIDVEFMDGDVLHSAAGDWFERAEAPETRN
jgi:hypothetical protein